MKFVRVVGARPQFIQVPVLAAELARRGHEHVLVHTGQHYDDSMSRIFFEQLGLPDADIHLNIGSGTQGEQTGRMIEVLEKVCVELRPDWVVVEGDTNSTLAGALAAKKLAIPILHVEAGVRCHIEHQPEEINRKVTDHVADLLCAPSPSGMIYLGHEGLAGRSVYTGDLLFDAFVRFSQKADHGFLEQLGIEPGSYVLSTMHRAETTSDYEVIRPYLDGLAGLGEPVIFPAHPRLKGILERYRAEEPGAKAIRFIEPVGYLQMQALIQGCRYIVSDSGGITREGPFSGKAVVLPGVNTAWEDLTQRRYVRTWTPEQGSLRDVVETLVTPDVAEVHALFGGGKAARNIVDAVEGRAA